MLGDVPLERVRAVRVGDADAVGEVGDACGHGLQGVHLHHIHVIAHAVDQVHGVDAALLGDFFQHGGERRQPRAPGQQQQRPLDFPQVETAQGTGQGHGVADRCLPGQKTAHQPAGHFADQEADFTALLQRAERIGTGLLATRHAEIDVLARQKCQVAQGLALERQGDGAFGKLANRADRRLKRGLSGFAHLAGGGHAHHAVAFGAHLASQYETLLRFFFAQGVFNVVFAKVVLTGLREALAGTASAVAAIERDVDALAVGRIGNCFAHSGINKTGHAVFKIQCDLVAHGTPRLTQ